MKLLTVSPEAAGNQQASQSRKTQNQASGGASFSDLIASLTSASLQNQATEITAAPASSLHADLGSSATVELASPPNTPLADFERSLTSTGQDLDEVSLPPEQAKNLKKTLIDSGYTEKDAAEIVKRATQDDGNVNLGAVFTLVQEYEPTQGLPLEIDASDKALLGQVLQELGVPDDEIVQFFNQAERHGDTIKLTGLPELLAKGKTGEVDRSVLTDLLSKLGLSQTEINQLLAKSMDAKGRMSPKAVLDVLQAAADKQDDQFAQTLKDMAAQVQVNNSGDSQAAKNLRAQVMQALQEGGPKFSQFEQNLAQAAEAKSDASTQAQADMGRLNQAAVGQQASQAKTDAQAQAAAAQSGQAQAAAKQNQGGVTQVSKGEGASVGLRQNTQTQAAPTRAAVPVRVVRQVGQQIAQMAKQGQTELKLELKPAHLGELNVEISVKDGLVKASLVAESNAAKHLLESGMEQLKQQLAAQGLKVDRIDVQVNPDANQQRQDVQAQANGGNNRGRGNNAGGSSGEGEASEDDLAEQGSVWQQASAGTGGGRISLIA